MIVQLVLEPLETGLQNLQFERGQILVMGGASAVSDSQPGNFFDVNFPKTGLDFDKEPMFVWHEHPMTSE